MKNMDPVGLNFPVARRKVALPQKRFGGRLVLQAGRSLVFILVILKCHFKI